MTYAQVFASLVAEEVGVVVLVLGLDRGVDARLAVRLGDASGQGLEVDGGVALDVVVLHVHPVVLVNRLSSHDCNSKQQYEDGIYHWQK